MVVLCAIADIPSISGFFHWHQVVLMNATAVEDLIIREDSSGKQRVGGVVTRRICWV